MKSTNYFALTKQNDYDNLNNLDDLDDLDDDLEDENKKLKTIVKCHQATNQLLKHEYNNLKKYVNQLEMINKQLIENLTEKNISKSLNNYYKSNKKQNIISDHFEKEYENELLAAGWEWT